MAKFTKGQKVVLTPSGLSYHGKNLEGVVGVIEGEYDDGELKGWFLPAYWIGGELGRRLPKAMEGSKDVSRRVSEENIRLANAARSRNAVVQKALNATGDKSKQKDWNVSKGTKGVYTAVRFHMPFDMNTWGPWYRGNFKPDRGQADTDKVRHFYDEASREKFIRDENRKNGFVVKGGEYVLPGYVPKTSWNADTGVLRETAVNANRTTNAVVAKALNASRIARNGYVVLRTASGGTARVYEGEEVEYDGKSYKAAALGSPSMAEATLVDGAGNKIVVRMRDPRLKAKASNAVEARYATPVEG